MDIKKVTYNSETQQVSSSSYLDWKRETDGYILFNIACGFVSTTEVSFVNENVVAVVTAYGNVNFLDAARNVLASACVPPDDEGLCRFVSLACKVENGKIYLQFPFYSWKDNYPYCDGEGDRWDAYVTGYHAPIMLEVSTGALVEE